jgi:RNA ligase (TIGR02306 family)
MKWAIEKTKIKEIKNHPNADLLYLIVLENEKQCVVKGDDLKIGEEVLFIPDRTIIRNENFEKEFPYLQKNNSGVVVKKTKIRGEMSEGIVLSEDSFKKITSKELKDTGIEQIIELFNAEEYFTPVPTSMSGEVEYIRIDKNFIKHDVENIKFYDFFEEGEEIIITEKIHGSQINILYGVFKNILDVKISSKNLFKQNLFLKKDDKNIFWRAFERTNIVESFFEKHPQFRDVVEKTDAAHLHFIGEIIPTQNLKYGTTVNDPKIKLFGSFVVFNNEIKDFSDSMIDVPILYTGKFNKKETIEIAKELAMGKECVSGRHLHIKEGVVVRPLKNRKIFYNGNSYYLNVKILNPEYKKIETGKELS